MQRSADLVDQEILALMRKHGLEGLTRSHLETLSLLLRYPPLTLSDIAVKIQRKKPTVTVLIDKLEAMGYCTRRLNPADSRSFLIVPTPKGKRQRRVVLRIFLTLRRISEQILSKEEILQLHLLSEKMYHGLFQRPETGGG